MASQNASEAAKEAVQPIKDWARSYVAEPVNKVLGAISKVPSSGAELKADIKSAGSRAERTAQRLARKYGIKK